MKGTVGLKSARQFQRKRRSSIRQHGRRGSGTSGVVSCGLRSAFRAWGCVLLLFMGVGGFFQMRAHRADGPLPPAPDHGSGFWRHRDDRIQDAPKPPRDSSGKLLAAVHDPAQGQPQQEKPPREMFDAGAPPRHTAAAEAAAAIDHHLPERRPPPAEPAVDHDVAGVTGNVGGGGGVAGGGGMVATASQKALGVGGVRGDGSGGGGAGAFPDPADGVQLVDDSGEGSAGPMETFLAEGGKLPIVLMTCNRDGLLKQTIESLRSVRGLDMSDVMVLQDGTDEKVAAVVEEERLYLKQHAATPRLKGGPKAGDGGGQRIAMHYKFALDHAFATRPEAPGVIIVEDDLLFSPDFLEYLEVHAPVLERDPTTLVLSAWNDNGYRGRVSDRAELKRTPYFPGLGWLFPRKLFDELRPRWPSDHWDHWLRDPKQHKGRESIFPEVPRTYHNGVKGTFMDKRMHDRLFKNIDYNLDSSFSWTSPPATSRQSGNLPVYAKVTRDNYERRVEARIRGARHINNLDDLPSSSAEREGEQVVMWYMLQHTEEAPNPRGGKSKGSPFKPLSDFFGIWHEYRRGEHSGMHTFRYDGGSHVMLINAAKSPYARLKPSALLPAQMNALRGGESGGGRGLKMVAGESASMSCDEVCSAKGMECKESTFELLNACGLLMDHFPCTKCSSSYGLEQPCYVELDAPEENYPGQCLLSSNPRESKCSASHHLTRRLCPCTSAIR